MGFVDTFDVQCCGFFVGFEPKVASVHSTEIKVQDVAVPGDVQSMCPPSWEIAGLSGPQHAFLTRLMGSPKGRGGLRCAAVTLYPDITNAIPATSAGGFKHGDGQEKTDSREKFIEVSA